MDAYARKYLGRHNELRKLKELEDAGRHWTRTERKVWVVMLFVLTAVLFSARVAMPVCATAMANEFGWNKADLGAVMGSFFWGYVTTQVLGGYFADKIGGDKVLCMSIFMWGSLTLLTPHIARYRSPIVSTMVLLTITRVLLGISQGVHYPSMMSLLGRKIPETERSLPMGFVLAASNFGTLTCGGFGSLLLEHRGWDDVFYIIGLTAILCTYVLYSIVRKPKSKVVSVESMIYSETSTPSEKQGVPWQHILTKLPVWSLICAHVCMNNCFYILLSWLPTFFHETYPEERGWVYNVVPWAMSIPTSILAGWVSSQLINAKWEIAATRKCMQLIAMLGSACFAILLPQCTNFFAALLCAGLAVSAQTFHNSGVLVNPQDIAPHFAGSVFGVMNAFGAIPGFVGVYFTGYILDTSKSWTVVFAVMGLINCVGVSVFVIWGKGKPIV